MASYGSVSDEYANTGANGATGLLRKDTQDHGYADQPEPSLLKKIVENRWLNLILFLVLWVIVFGSIACVTVVAVLHYHLLFVCGYAEFIFLVALEGIVLSFCLYHIFHIFQLFKKRAQQNPVKGPFAWFADPSTFDDNSHYEANNVDEEYDQDYEDDDVDEDNDGEESRTTKIFIFVLKTVSLLVSVAAMIVLFLFTVVAVPIQQSTLPQTSGSLNFGSGKLTGSTPPVITREANGIVHIQAQTVHDALFAQGVVHAQDRMWQLEFHKRIGAGSLAEIAGPDAIDVDKGSRTIGFRVAGTSALSALSQDIKDMLQAYCDGINAFYESNPALSPEFSLLKIKPSKWEPLDVTTWAKVMAFSLSANHQREIIRYRLLQQGLTKSRIDQLLPLYPKDKITVLSAAQLNITLSEKEIDELEALLSNDDGFYQPSLVNNTKTEVAGFYKPMQSKLFSSAFDSVFLKPMMAKASNNWVVAGKLTKSGKPMLANDPHLEQTAPGIWYLNHIQSADGLDVIGASFAGSPGVIIGRNKDISWGVTNSFADAQDIFAIHEKVAGESYVHNNAVKDYKKRTETIKVKGRADVTLTVLETVYGPVVNDMMGVEQSVPLSMHWVGRDEADTTVSAYMKLNFAKNHEDFLNAMRLYVVPSQNFVYADTQGNIAYHLAGKIPIRSEGHSGRYVVPGNGTYDYFDEPTNYIPFDKLPQIVNPARGFVSSANNRVTPRGFEYSISQDFFEVYRAQRIDYLLANKTFNGTVSWKDMRDIQYDVHSALFEDFRFIFKQLAGNVSKEIDTWRDKLVKWDADEKLYSQEASIFEMWFYNMGNMISKESNNKIKNWRDPAYLIHALNNNDIGCTLAYNKTCFQVAGIVLEESIESLEKTYGSVPLWGSDIHQVDFVHQLLKGRTIGCLASKTMMNIGGTETANVGVIEDQYLTTREGVSYRQIIDMANDYKGGQAPASDKFIIPLGQSGNFLSPLYDNFIQKWKDGSFIDMKMANFEVYKKLTVKTK